MDSKSGGDVDCVLANTGGTNETKHLNPTWYFGITDLWMSVIFICGCKEAMKEKGQPAGFFLTGTSSWI